MKKYKMPKGKKKLMIDALGGSLGIVSTACRQVGISRQVHYNWLKNDENYKYHVEEASQVLKDFGEHALLKLIKDENPAAVIFFNKTRNKDRGYYEKQEIEHSGGILYKFNEIVKSVEEIQNDKGNNDDIQPEAGGDASSSG
jgi:hypothetical protein